MRIIISAAMLSLLASGALAQQNQQPQANDQFRGGQSSQQSPMQMQPRDMRQRRMQQREMMQGGMQGGGMMQGGMQRGGMMQGGMPPDGMTQKGASREQQDVNRQTSGVGASQHQTNRPLISPEAAQVPMVNLTELYRGWRGSKLVGQDVYGRNGEEIGEVYDIILNPDGRIAAIIVEAGGFLDIGDSHVRIPWRQVNLTGSREGIQIPYVEDQLDSAGLFNDSENVFVGAREFRLSELRGDYVRLMYGPGFGQVQDVVFNQNGQAIAVLVTRDVTYGGGIYAYPYYGYGYGWRPGWAYYAIPFERVDLASTTAPAVALNRFKEPWDK